MPDKNDLVEGPSKFDGVKKFGKDILPKTGKQVIGVGVASIVVGAIGFVVGKASVNKPKVPKQ